MPTTTPAFRQLVVAANACPTQAEGLLNSWVN